MKFILRRYLFPALALAAAGSAASALLVAQNPPGAIRLMVDATQAPQKILHAHMTMPVEAGPLTLYYPEWIPGEHAPDGPITDLAGLAFSSGGKVVPWRRDLDDMFAFHLDIPQGVTSLDVRLDFLLSAPTTGFSAGASATENVDLLSWNQVLLYPKGRPVSGLTYAAGLMLPQGWKFSTALPVAGQSGNAIEFKPVALETLVDSPVLSGRYFRVIQLTPGQQPSHEIDIAADSETALEMPPEMQGHYKQLVAETGALFGSRHYREYHFLLTLSDDVAHFGLEHHESSDDRIEERSLIDDALRIRHATLLPHEFVHSWNGKYRRPADLTATDYQQPRRDDLLWVYEGLTEYLGEILAARSGLYSERQAQDDLALIAATFDHRPGRTWRSLQDTADSAQLLYFAADAWENWRRGVDYYDEGTLLWLEVDTRLRLLTHGQKSLNDFCRVFHGGPEREPATKTYTFEDVVAALNQVAPYDWRGLLTERLTSTDPRAPLAGIENGGWKLVYNASPNPVQQSHESSRHDVNLSFSVGMVVEDDGTLKDVIYGMPAYEAGVGPGMKITGVNSKQFSQQVLRESIEASTMSNEPITLLLANGNSYRTAKVDYHGGMRYPHLERDEGRPDLLDEIMRPLAPGGTTTAETAEHSDR